MPGAKRHHRVPEYYQEGFCETDRIFVYDRGTKAIRRDSPKNVEVVGHYYSVFLGGSVPDSRFEDFLAEIEGRANPVLHKLRQTHESISVAERISFALYLGYFFVRGPRFLNMATSFAIQKANEFAAIMRSPEAARRIIDESDLSPEEKATADPHLLAEFAGSSDWSVDVNHDFIVKKMFETGPELAQLLVGMDWMVAEADLSDGFITSDNPLFTIAGPITVFPPSSRACLLMSPGQSRFARKAAPSRLVADTNRDIALASARYIMAAGAEKIREVVAAAL